MNVTPFWAIKIRKTGMKKRWIIPLMLLSPVSVTLWLPVLPRDIQNSFNFLCIS